MSDKLNHNNSRSEEVDLGQLFNAIRKVLFENLFAFIGNHL